ncbi:MAG: hypothetical protein GVY36_08770 [Verrucomicrobia bacterium]|nr:hypothetical protein [Verrucomicrobiota bacterium]
MALANNIPTNCWSGTMLGVDYDQLPHWVVDYGCYSLTLHCADSIPKGALEKLREYVAHQSAIESTDDDFLQQNRRQFKMMEHYLDQSMGACPLRPVKIRQSLTNYLTAYDEELRFKSWVIMPNHLHLITDPMRFSSTDAFKKAITRFKMRSTRYVNLSAKRSGKLWMSSAYDRWIRSESEYRRWIDYLRNNPAKAGLCSSPDEWIGLKI